MGKADLITAKNYPIGYYIPAMIQIKIGKRSLFSTLSRRFQNEGEVRSAAFAIAAMHGIVIDEKTELVMLLDPSSDPSE